VFIHKTAEFSEVFTFFFLVKMFHIAYTVCRVGQCHA